MPGKRKQLPPEKSLCGIGARPPPRASPPSSSSPFYWGQPGNSPSASRLGAGYFDQPCIRLAKGLLGQMLVRKLPDGRLLRGRIVETEAYLGGDDTASHSRGGRQTARNMAMFMPPGTLYVYQIYGIYFCMNVSSQGEGAAVLLRSLEPLQGLDAMRELRLAQRKGAARPLKDRQLCNGPSKLCQALAIDKSFDQKDLACSPALWLEPSLEAPTEAALICTSRIGISGEWACKPLRFYLRGNECVSVTDKKAERAKKAERDTASQPAEPGRQGSGEAPHPRGLGEQHDMNTHMRVETGTVS